MRSLKAVSGNVTLVLLLLASTLLVVFSLGACASSTRSYFMGDVPTAPSYARGVARLAWSRDGEDILFSVGGLLGIFVVDSAGRELRAYPGMAPPIGDRHNPGAFAPALSPDGTRVAYNAFAPLENIVIETAAFDGSDVRRLTPVKLYRDEQGDVEGRINGDVSTYPVWSPDGKQIAFKRDFSETAFISSLDRSKVEPPLGEGIYVMEADGSNLRAVAPSISTDFIVKFQPVLWSPDGSSLALVGYDPDSEWPYHPILYTVKPDGSELVRLTPTELNVPSGKRSVEWSPDGAWLAFQGFETSAEGKQRHGAFTVRADGTGLTRLTPKDYGGSVFAWSPDSDWLAFTNGQTVYVTRPDGAELRQVAIGNGVPLVWTPDGEEILIKGLGYAVRLDGSGMREWVSGGVPNIVRTAWSPDGSRLAVLSEDQRGGFKLYSIAGEGTERRVLARGTTLHVAAEHSGWRNVSNDIATCADIYKGFTGLVEDCRTLLSIRDTLAGETLLNWRSDVNIRDWEGVSIEGGEGADLRPPRVRKLALAGRDYPYVTGMIPPEIGALGELEFLNLSGNSLTGGIPPELGMLSKLETLYLKDNNLTGSIPPELGNLASLKYLSLSGNTLSGEVPPELGKLENLRTLELHRNYDLSGCVPAVLASRLTQNYGTGLEYCE